MAPISARKDISMAKRLEIIRKLENGVSVSQLVNEYGLCSRTIQRYRQNAASIQEFSANLRSMDVKRKRASLNEDVNARLYTWFLERRAAGDTVTDSLLQEKARQIHKDVGSPTSFTGSRGWLWRFKTRYDINAPSNDRDQVDPNCYATERFVNELSDLLDKGAAMEEDLYNMEEASVAWRALPRKVVAREGDQWTNELKRKRERVTVAFCANATGTHKLPPLFAHKYTNPRALKHCKDSLPVVYMRQTDGRLDKNAFQDWYTNYFRPCTRQRQLQEYRSNKVILIVDSYRQSMIPKELWEDSHFRLMFLPPNNDKIQPMDLDVIASCKKSFRRKLLSRVLQYNGGVQQFYADYDIKDCIDLVVQAWNNIIPAEIEYSWRKLLERKPHVDPLVKHEPEMVLSDEEAGCFGNISDEEIAEWISECEKLELRNESAETKEENGHLDCQIEEEEIDHMFYNLAIWSETQPPFVKLHAKFLIDYYNQK